MTTPNTVASSQLLRRALQANGVFSALSGVILVIASSRIAALIGIEQSLWLTGLLLLLFAASLLRNAARAEINLTEAWIAVALDVAWVAGTAALIFAGVFSATGNWVAALVGDVVLLFAVLQFLGLRKLRRQAVSGIAIFLLAANAFFTAQAQTSTAMQEAAALLQAKKFDEAARAYQAIVKADPANGSTAAVARAN